LNNPHSPELDRDAPVAGIGMAAAIFLDATVVRLLLVPAVMHILGRANWWLPRFLHRLPELHIEGRPEVHLAHRSRETGPARAPEPARV
jgi:RND superfamily putative drug exporter